METTSIILIATLATTTLGGVLALLQKYIKRSSCLGSSIEFRTNEEVAVAKDVSTNVSPSGNFVIPDSAFTIPPHPPPNSPKIYHLPTKSIAC